MSQIGLYKVMKLTRNPVENTVHMKCLQRANSNDVSFLKLQDDINTSHRNQQHARYDALMANFEEAQFRYKPSMVNC